MTRHGGTGGGRTPDPTPWVTLCPGALGQWSCPSTLPHPAARPPMPLPHSRGLCPSPPRFEGPQEGLHPPAHRGAHPPCHRVSRGCGQAGAGGLGPRVQALLVAELWGARGSAGARGARGGAGAALTTQAACSASLSPAALGSHHTMWQRKVPGALAMMKAKARTSRPTPMKDRNRTRHSHSTASVWGHGGHWGTQRGEGAPGPQRMGSLGTTGGEAADIGVPIASGRGTRVSSRHPQDRDRVSRAHGVSPRCLPERVGGSHCHTLGLGVFSTAPQGGRGFPKAPQDLVGWGHDGRSHRGSLVQEWVSAAPLARDGHLDPRKGSLVRMGVNTSPQSGRGSPLPPRPGWWVMEGVGGGPRAGVSEEGTHLAVSNGEGGRGHADHHRGGCRGLPRARGQRCLQCRVDHVHAWGAQGHTATATAPGLEKSPETLPPSP